MKVDRLLAIIVLLLNRDKISANELAERFGVSARTIYRDIESINIAGIPIISYPGNNGGFGILKNYRLDRQIISFNDMIHIINSLKGINKSLENNEINLIIEKIRSIIPSDKKELASIKEQEMIYDPNPWFQDKGILDNYKMLHHAITEKYIAKIQYINLKNESTERIIEPLSLFHKGNNTYLISFCREKNDFRMFKLSRISQISTIKEKFVRKQIPSDFIKSYESNNNNGTKIKLKFSNNIKNRILEYRFLEEIEYFDNHIIAKVNFPEDQWIYSFILSFGDDAEVLEPLRIREIIKEKIKNLKNIYQT